MKQITFIIMMVLGWQLVASAQTDKINWVSFEEALVLNEKEPKKFFIDFYTNWCGWCKKLDAVTFVDPEVVDLMNKHYYAIKFDAERKDTIKFQNKEYVYYKTPESRRGYHTLAAALMNNKLSYPTMVIMQVEQGTQNVTFHNPLSGYMDGNAIEPILQYIGEELYTKNIVWEEYRANYATKKSE